MRKMKYVIGILILFMVIGFATVTVSLSLSGNAKLTGDIGNFKVYFSDVKLNDETDLSLVKSETEIIFDVLLREIGTTHKISYDVTNASSMFDANLSVSCTQGDEFVSVTNEFDSSTLPALTTRTGNLTIKKLKAYASDTNKDYTISCTITASPVERDSQASGEVVSPVQPVKISTGDVISIVGERFNVISQTDTTVTMLAQYNLGTDYRQNSLSIGDYGAAPYVSMGTGWGQPSTATEIDLNTYSPDVVNYLDNYVDYLNQELDIDNLEATLITVKELGNLDCSIDENYSLYSMTCSGSKYESWLIINHCWLTRSADSSFSSDYFAVMWNGTIESSDLAGRGGVRPVITIPIQIARKYFEYKWYDIGEEIAIEDEMFNVISDNGDTITMLAQYNLGTDYRQTEVENLVTFADTNGWEYTPGPKEIDIQVWSTNPKTYVNEYVSYLKGLIGENNLKGNLITIKELQELGCYFHRDDYAVEYTHDARRIECSISVNSDWLVNGQEWWTRSAISDYRDDVWVVPSSGDKSFLGDYPYLFPYNFLEGGIRPIITISKDYI